MANEFGIEFGFRPFFFCSFGFVRFAYERLAQKIGQKSVQCTTKLAACTTGQKTEKSVKNVQQKSERESGKMLLSRQETIKFSPLPLLDFSQTSLLDFRIFLGG